MKPTRPAAVHRMSVATNFDPRLPAELGGFNRASGIARVVRVFGSLPADDVGGGRPAYRLPAVGPQALFDHVAEVSSQGIEFAYTLNAPDLFGAELDPAWRRSLDRFLGELWEGGIRRLVVSNRWLLRHLGAHHRFQLSLSLIGGVATAGEAAAASDLGVDEITLAGQAVNRDLPAIERIRAATDLTLAINANMACLLRCPWSEDHYRTLGSLSRGDRVRASGDAVHTEPHILECSCRLLADPTLFVRSSFVPPTYLDRYRDAGVDLFKFSDRTSDTGSLLRTVRAYGAVDPPDDLYAFVYKKGAKLKAPLRGLFPAGFVDALPTPRFSIDARRFADARFIERQAAMTPQEQQELARSILTVHDPGYTGRYRAFMEAVRDRVAGRALIPAAELPDLEALRAILDPLPGDPDEGDHESR